MKRKQTITVLAGAIVILSAIATLLGIFSSGGQGNFNYKFLSLLMTALTAKIIAMGINDVNIIPAVFIIPAINLVTILCTVSMVQNIKENRI